VQALPVPDRAWEAFSDCQWWLFSRHSAVRLLHFWQFGLQPPLSTHRLLLSGVLCLSGAVFWLQAVLLSHTIGFSLSPSSAGERRLPVYFSFF